MTNQKQVHAFISGRVQGVWYRASTEQKAKQLKLSGWVRNRSDGRVELLAQGDELQLKELLVWCKRGPELAQVEEIHDKWSEIENPVSEFSTLATL